MNKALKLMQKLLLEFFALGRTYSWRYATYNLTWWVCFYIRTRFTWSISKWALKKKTAWLDSYFDGEIIDIEDLTEVQKHLTITEFKLWVFWGQGEADMPPLIKACYRQLNKYNENVCLVTYNNVRDYIDLPEIIYKKVRNGKLTWAHFSDIVRTSLLAKHGGLWLDATVWVSGKLPINNILKMSFWSANSKLEHGSHDVCFWTSGEWNWSTWCMSANHTNSCLFHFLSKNMKNIACQYQVWPDYVFQDYLIHFACRHYISIKTDVEKMEIHNPYRNTLSSLMNKEFDSIVYKTLTQSEFVHKLSFKTKLIENHKNNYTFWGAIKNGYVDNTVKNF